MTLNEADPVLPCASVDAHVTVVAPSGNVEPLAGRQVTPTTPSSVSVAEAVNVCGAPVRPVASILTLAGTVTVGGVVSATVTVNDAVPLLLRVSDAVQVTGVWPSGNIDPLAGVQVNVAPAGPVASTVALAGTLTTGGVVSGACSTVTSVIDHADTLSAASNARAVKVTGPAGTAAVFQLPM